MALITLADVEAALPGMTFDGTTLPTSTQVSGYIDAIEAEVKAQLVATGAAWPANTSTTGGAYLRQTLIEGAIWRTLRAKYATYTEQPEAVRDARDAYTARVKTLLTSGMLIMEHGGVPSGAVSTPVVGDQDYAPALSGSLDAYTAQRATLDAPGTSTVGRYYR